MLLCMKNCTFQKLIMNLSNHLHTARTFILFIFVCLFHLTLSNLGTNFSKRSFITKTCLYNFNPLKPHFYIVKLGFTGIYIIFLLLLKSIDCGYSLEPPRRGGTHNLCFEPNYEKISEFLFDFFFHFLVVKFSIYLNRHVS